MIMFVVYDWSILLFFFFKQKTAYEMRISDWSSDVCSSDLHDHRRAENLDIADQIVAWFRKLLLARKGQPAAAEDPVALKFVERLGTVGYERYGFGEQAGLAGVALLCSDADLLVVRSEEHTSELQSLMRISYAVFCLKKKKTEDT